MTEPSGRPSRKESESGPVERTGERLAIDSDALLRCLVDSGIVGISVVGDDGVCMHANAAFLELVGYTHEEMLAGAISSDTITPPEWRALEQLGVQRMREGRVLPLREMEYMRKDGTRVEVLAGGARLDHASHVVYVADISERRRAEEALRKTEQQLRQSQKMEAVGRLTGGIVHDFNNLMSIVLTYSTLLAMESPANAPRRADIDEIRHAAERAAALTQRLLAFSRRHLVQPTVVDLNQTLAGIVRLLQRTLGEDIEVNVVPGQPLGRVLIDPHQLEQVIMNLAVNARDAMPRGGRLTFRTSDATLDDAAAATLSVTPGSYVLLVATDTGVGMDALTQQRIFEPFFTTKEKDHGTGLGLSTVLSIVRQSGGNVSVQSALGTGTSFRVYLPVPDEGVAETSPPISAPPTSSELDHFRGSETILLVEDDSQVRASMRAMLSWLGYRVLEAHSGIEALAIAERHHGTIDLLLTDVVMPRMEGPQVAEELLAARPELRVLFVSGYTDHQAVVALVRKTDAELLPKPVTPELLAKKLRRMLDASKPARSR